MPFRKKERELRSSILKPETGSNYWLLLSMISPNWMFGKIFYCFLLIIRGFKMSMPLILRTNRVWQVTSSRFGAFDVTVSPDGRNIAYADYSVMGFNLVESPLDSLKWIPISKVRDNSVKLYAASNKAGEGSYSNR